MRKKLVNYYRSLGIGSKLSGGFRFVNVLLVVISVCAVAALLLSCWNMRDFYSNAYNSNITQSKMREDVQGAEKFLVWSLSTTDTTKIEQYVNESNAYVDSVSDRLEELKKTFHNDKLVADTEAEFEVFAAQQEDIVKNVLFDDYDKAFELLNSTYAEASENLQTSLAAVGEEADKEAESKYKTTVTLASVCIFVILVIGLFSIVITLLVTKVITRQVITPVAEIGKATEQLSNGDLNLAIEYTSQDEFGVLIQNFANSCAMMREIILDVDKCLSEMANCNFSYQSEKEERYVGEFRHILDGIKQMNQQMNEALHQIDDASEQVAMGAIQLADGAQSLAEGATEQAGAVEELTANVEEVAGIAEESAKVAYGAYEGVLESQKDAAQSQQNLNDLTQAMARINDTSVEIQNIIGAIEDIASQTNLLSLNASIEAARAGEAGRGFAVVADQIGKLATDSAQSAVNTKQLIEKSLAEIEAGNEITKKTVESLNAILDAMGAFGDAAKGASEASNHQASMLKQIQMGIEQISEVVQTNSAAAQENSATSEELSAQSETLKEVVQRFELR